jgi:hypothetical protein
MVVEKPENIEKIIKIKQKFIEKNRHISDIEEKEKNPRNIK